MNITEKVGFVLHPTDLEMYQQNMLNMKPHKQYNDKLVLKLLEWSPSFRYKTFENVSYETSKTVPAALYLVPFLPQMRDIDMKKVTEKVIEAIRLAQQDGCTVVALGGFTSIVLQGQEDDLSRNFNIRITSGNTATATVIIRSLFELHNKFGLLPGKSKVAIIGASGDIGTGLFQYLGEHVDSLFLNARGKQVLENIVNKYRSFLDCDITVTDTIEEAVLNANVVIFVTSSNVPVFNLKDFKPGTIVCDASAPQNVNIPDNALRDDVFIYHGGIAQLPYEVDFGFNIGLAEKSHMHGCQFEGILNALKPDLPSSIGRGNINPRKINRFMNLFDELQIIRPVYTIGSYTYSDKDLSQYTEYFKNKPR